MKEEQGTCPSELICSRKREIHFFGGRIARQFFKCVHVKYWYCKVLYIHRLLNYTKYVTFMTCVYKDSGVQSSSQNSFNYTTIKREVATDIHHP